MSNWRCVFVAVLLTAFCCGSEDSATEEVDRSVDAPPGPEALLRGTWRTTGVDELLGEVEVLLTLEEDGGLHMVLLLSGGGQRSFPGSWEVNGDELVLRGIYFEPDEESRVRWEIREDGFLVLEEETGKQQEWERVE